MLKKDVIAMTYVNTDHSKINQKRLEIIEKGYVSRRDICEFIPCSYNKARKIWNTITSNIHKEGFEQIDDNIMLAGRLLNYLGLSEEKIKAAIEKENRQTASLKTGRYGVL